MEDLLVASGLSVRYGPVVAVAGVDVRVGAGEVCAILGANGAGKSSIIRALVGVVQSEGTIEFPPGNQLQGLPPHLRRKRGVAWVPEGRDIFTTLTVRENLLMGAFQERERSRVQELLKEMYEVFPILAQRREHLGGELSGGEQQMLAIARALMGSPQLLLMDEPSLGLAPQIVETVFRLISEINQRGIAILMAEQNAREALHAAHRAYLLENGRVTEEGESGGLAENARVQRAYLGG